MKLLWVKTDFLHPTTRGGQIRTLELLRQLHRRHEIHYIAFNDPKEPEGLERATEYCSKAYPIDYQLTDKSSPAFLIELLTGLFSSLPVSIRRCRSTEMKRQLERLIPQERFDCVVCDFLSPAPNIPDLSNCVLFQHNVEAIIWKRRTEHAPDPLRRFYLKLQADRMSRYEGEVCGKVRKVIAVSESDAALMREWYGVKLPDAVPTGVDADYFKPRGPVAPAADLVFVGSMDWAPNVDGIEWFEREVLPAILARKPGCTVAIVGRTPPPQIRDLAARHPGVQVTGTVPDVRPWLWGSKISIVPLRVGGGTRLKIFEAMAAGAPVVSTTVGAEGLGAKDGETIRIADRPEDFAAACLELLDDQAERERLRDRALQMVTEKFSWEGVAATFEHLLMGA
jgi:glycosyltransferase involved in cell wall biosynthesis